MTKFIFTLLLTASLISCAQESKDKTMTTQQRIEYFSGKVQKFEREPLYQLDIQSVYNFRVLVNGNPVYSNFDKIPGTAKVNINSSILKSGKQSIEIELYPGYDNNGVQKLYLGNGENFVLKVEKTGWNKDGSLQTPEEVVEFRNDDQEIDYSKLAEYKTKISFNASVPYNLTGWENGEDLSKLNQKELETKVVSFYKNMASAFKEKNYDYLNTVFLNADNEWYQAEYFPKDVIAKFQSTKGRKAKSVSTTKAESDAYSQTIYSIENYVMKFYGNNRMVRLEPKEGVNRGESLLGYEDIDKSGMNRKTFIDMLLYIPKGTQSLQIIR